MQGFGFSFFLFISYSITIHSFCVIIVFIFTFSYMTVAYRDRTYSPFPSPDFPFPRSSSTAPVNLSSSFTPFSFWDPVNLIGIAYIAWKGVICRAWGPYQWWHHWRIWLFLFSRHYFLISPQREIRVRELHPLAAVAAYKSPGKVDQGLLKFFF